MPRAGGPSDKLKLPSTTVLLLNPSNYLGRSFRVFVRLWQLAIAG
ncbi:MAG TPA: hypothetical protein VJR04_16960 [Terriglobales bacterium]|nr:hypothetical protein [Terriglobales bacterium]